MYQFLAFCASSLLFLTCANESPSNTTSTHMDMAESAAPVSQKRQTNAQSLDQTHAGANVVTEKIIRNANISLEVNDVKQAKASLDQTLKSFNAYYQREIYHASDYRSNYDIVIRVPSEHFQSLLTDIENGDGYIKSKQVNANNVTEEYIDISMRLKNSRRYLDQYNSILKKAKTIKEILEVQETVSYTHLTLPTTSRV